ncbi:MAG: 2-C-methyl-D-erythritol 4-phosphate cytidylyltransferase [Thermomicrobiales bacterium]|nr:2-C-methyl-D-erythritol 4-phosphate cytidylyltransferase [Thermomicrobiales bacterium]
MPSAPDRPTAAAVIVAAGRGTRLGAADKILLPLADRPLLAHSIDAAEAAETILDIVIVAGLHTKAQIERLVAASSWRKVRHVALGGDRRQDSVEAGLRLVRDDVDVVAVHDGARPLAEPGLFDACVRAAATHGGAIAAIPVADTLKRVQSGLVVATVPRDDMWAAQTPQACRASLLRAAFAHVTANRLEVTDEAGLMEAFGVPVAVVPSTSRNIKITRPDDLQIAEALLTLNQGSRHR